MPKIVQIIGTRPQYEKLIRFDDDYVIDTGQHYSENLNLDKPEVNETFIWVNIPLAVNCISHMLLHGEIDLPKLIIVYGDTFSTLVGCLVAKRLDIPLAHIEAGITYGTNVESKIRRYVDKMSKYRFCVNSIGLQNLYNISGINDGYKNYVVGDLLYDKFLKVNTKSRCNITILTIHRRENLLRLSSLIEDLSNIEGRIWFFAHPHALKTLLRENILLPDNISLFEPVSYADMIKYLSNARHVITDSGGLVREAYWSGVPFSYIGINPWPETEMFGNGQTESKIREVINEIM